MKRDFFLKLAIVLASVVLFFYILHEKKPDKLFYLDTLSRARIQEEVVVDGNKYRVGGGKIRPTEENFSDEKIYRITRLAYSKALAKRSPIMALPGTDIEKLKIAISSLSEVKDNLSKSQKKELDSELIISSLYPTNFLKDLANLESDRLSFISEGSETSESKYKSSGEKAFENYKKDLLSFKSSFINAVPPNVRPFATEGKLITRDGIIKALDILLSGIEKTKFALEKRNRCLEGKTRECLAKELDLPSIDLPEKQIIKPELISQAKNIRSIISQTTGKQEILSSPIIAITDGICISNTPGAPLFLLYKEKIKDKNIDYTRVFFIGNLRFIDSETQKDIEFFKHFADNGIKYVISLPNAYYECPQSGRDFGKITSINRVIDFSKKYKVSFYARGNTKKMLSDMELGFSSIDTPITERDAIQYILLSQDTIKKEIVPENVQNEIISISLELKNMSSGFESFLLGMYWVERNYIEFISKGIPIPIDATYLYFVRSSAINLFLSHNPSVVGTHKPFFKKNKIPFDKQPFIFYSSLPRTPEIEKILKKDILFSLRLHHNSEI